MGKEFRQVQTVLPWLGRLQRGEARRSAPSPLKQSRKAWPRCVTLRDTSPEQGAYVEGNGDIGYIVDNVMRNAHLLSSAGFADDVRCQPRLANEDDARRFEELVRALVLKASQVFDE